MVVPDKEAVYADKLPPHLVPAPRRPVHRLLEIAEAEGVEIIYPLAELRAGRTPKTPVYTPTDSHWNARGAYIAYRLICEHLRRRGIVLHAVDEQDVSWFENELVGDLGIKFEPPRGGTVALGRIRSPRARLVSDNQIRVTGRRLEFECDRDELPRCVVFGTSYATGFPVSEYVGSRIVNSLVLMSCAAVISTPVAIAVGTYTALRRDRAVDHATSVVTLVLAALPEFVVGILLIVVFSTGVFKIFPAVYVSLGSDRPWDNPSQLILPTLTLVLAVSPYIARIMRATMVEVLESEYVQQARLKGLTERTVLTRHALPNAVGPVAQVVALQLAYLAGGVVVIEYLFRFPGIGFALVDAVNNRDLPIVQTLALLIAAVYIVVNLIADVVTLAANPKTRTAIR